MLDKMGVSGVKKPDFLLKISKIVHTVQIYLLKFVKYFLFKHYLF